MTFDIVLIKNYATILQIFNKLIWSRKNHSKAAKVCPDHNWVGIKITAVSETAFFRDQVTIKLQKIDQGMHVGLSKLSQKAISNLALNRKKYIVLVWTLFNKLFLKDFNYFPLIIYFDEVCRDFFIFELVFRNA